MTVISVVLGSEKVNYKRHVLSRLKELAISFCFPKTYFHAVSKLLDITIQDSFSEQAFSILSKSLHTKL